MNMSDPQILYMVLILPSLFGLTLLGEGVSKILESKISGIINIALGMLFIATAVFGHFFILGN